jgi:hypothetical protein
MELTGQKKVHIIPMGFEIDRIEIPLRDIGADRVYLITDLKESETGTLYLKELTRRIRNLVLEKELTCTELYTLGFHSRRAHIGRRS